MDHSNILHAKLGIPHECHGCSNWKLSMLGALFLTRAHEEARSCEWMDGAGFVYNTCFMFWLFFHLLLFYQDFSSTADLYFEIWEGWKACSSGKDRHVSRSRSMERYTLEHMPIYRCHAGWDLQCMPIINIGSVPCIEYIVFVIIHGNFLYCKDEMVCPTAWTALLVVLRQSNSGREYNGTFKEPLLGFSWHAWR
jgi:hypothetical protein